MNRSNSKEQILKLVQELPDDATVEDAMDRLYLLLKVERGLAQADLGKKSLRRKLVDG
jgi:hypothetical protein